jgi:hypothetical protein
MCTEEIAKCNYSPAPMIQKVLYLFSMEEGGGESVDNFEGFKKMFLR